MSRRPDHSPARPTRAPASTTRSPSAPSPRAPSPRSPPAAPSPRSSPRSSSRIAPPVDVEGEHKVAGENACRALFLTRPDDIRRVYVTEAVLPRFKDVLKFCAERRLAYHVKTDDDLDQIAETVHHDGVLFLARRQQERTLKDLFTWADGLRPEQRALVVLLENVKNPHNLGAILRVCAHFGVPFVLRAGQTPALSPAAMRTAEGGAEHSRVVGADDTAGLDTALTRLQKAGFRLLATSSHATLALGREALPSRAVVMFGSEGEGLSPTLMKRADDVVAIPGSGALESLNVACAASVVLWELWRGADDARAPQVMKTTTATTTTAGSRPTPWKAKAPPAGQRPRDGVKDGTGPHAERRGRNAPRRGGPRG